MSTASSAVNLLNNIELAQKDLAMYAAIIGCKPTVEPAEAPSTAEPQTPEPAPEAHEPRRITIWMRHVSHEAKKRFDEACMRLAS